MQLTRFRFKNIHQRAKENIIADCLSYMYDPSEFKIVDNLGEEHCFVIQSIYESFVSRVKWQDQDEEYEYLKAYVAAVNTTAYCVSEGILYIVGRNGVKSVFVPKKIRAMILRYFHDSEIGGHLGITKTNYLAKRDYLSYCK
ncbi:hypothetical protein PR048_012057 [Dryococelus australis]|uniref:Integrase zinc-binding domain-containing protein n=1 Tax=Dryococelus australis TaxID=614101 RepID=A0ABQ9HNC9_9NEOP|nr:hypothetical protein PR048_012057 [Dryococelus australis]